MKEKPIIPTVTDESLNLNSRRQLVAEYALLILEKHLQEVRNVADWVAMAGYSTRWLGKCLISHIGKTPSAVLKEERYKKICSAIKSNPTATALSVAGFVAPHWNDRYLYNFLSKYYNTNFTKLRYDVLMDELKMGEENSK